MKSNIAWSVAYNSVGLVLAASGLLHPLAAAAAMLMSSLAVLGNSRRWRAG
jgi:cation transport ATPase